MTGTGRSVTLEDGPPTWRVPHVGRLFTHGQGSDRPSAAGSRPPARLAAENRQLRVRVGELEALVTRLMEENDRLAVASASALDSPHLDSEHLEMQPA